jgi:metacaspase-1
MIEYLKDCHGFEEENMIILMDDGEHTDPTAANIQAAFRQIVADAEPGDAVFCHYSGHGCSIRDDEYEEEDRKDEALCPVDYQKSGVLRDDDVYKMLVAPMPKDVVLTCVMDCCHSGTILDLPYGFLADGQQEKMQMDEEYDFGSLLEGLKARRKKRRARWANRFGS